MRSNSFGSVTTISDSPSVRMSSAPSSIAWSVSFSSSTAAFSNTISPCFLNIQPTEPDAPRLPPWCVITLRISLAVRLRLSVMISTSTAVPPGPNTS